MNLETRTKDTRQGYIQMAIGAALISFSAVFVRGSDLGPIMAGFYRNLFGGIFSADPCPLSTGRLVARWTSLSDSPCRGGVLCSRSQLLAPLDPVCRTGSGNIDSQFSGLFPGSFGILVFKEAAGWRLLISIPLAVTGLFMLVGIEWNRLEANYQLGVYLGLASALAYSFYLLVLRRSQSDTPRLGHRSTF